MNPVFLFYFINVLVRQLLHRLCFQQCRCGYRTALISLLVSHCFPANNRDFTHTDIVQLALLKITC